MWHDTFECYHDIAVSIDDLPAISYVCRRDGPGQVIPNLDYVPQIPRFVHVKDTLSMALIALRSFLPLPPQTPKPRLLLIA